MVESATSSIELTGLGMHAVECVRGSSIAVKVPLEHLLSEMNGNR